MNCIRFVLSCLLIFFFTEVISQEPQKWKQELAAQNEKLFSRLQQVHSLSDSQMVRIRAIFDKSPSMSQGNPAITRHPVTEEECGEMLKKEGIRYDNPAFEKICGGKYMAPLYDPENKKPESAKACIDQFEFPDIPCTYPVVWVRAREAALICEIMGKRLCDAHEWEGACEGRLLKPDYRFDIAAGKDLSSAVRSMGQAHNQKWGAQKKWAYGNAYEKGICGCASHKNENCQGGSWSQCGSNTYPSGYFPRCKSALWASDMHGNAAEHMNLPLKENQMSSSGSKELGYTEMKGSWFIFDKYYAHQDWCRWRAPYWHGSRVMDLNSHHNYHLGFRCCKTVEPQKKEKTQ